MVEKINEAFDAGLRTSHQGISNSSIFDAIIIIIICRSLSISLANPFTRKYGAHEHKHFLNWRWHKCVPAIPNFDVLEISSNTWRDWNILKYYKNIKNFDQISSTLLQHFRWRAASTLPALIDDVSLMFKLLTQREHSYNAWHPFSQSLFKIQESVFVADFSYKPFHLPFKEIPEQWCSKQ